MTALIILLAIGSIAIGLYRWKQIAAKQRRRLVRRQRSLEQQENWERLIANRANGSVNRLSETNPR